LNGIYVHRLWLKYRQRLHMKMLSQHLGFIDPAILSLTVDTPMGMTVLRSSIYHIVEKRMDARERCVKMTLDTLDGPLEVSKVAFIDDSYRLVFIGAYDCPQ